MSSERFIIDCYGIIDTYKELTGYCEKDKLSWSELCDTLNELDSIANSKLNEYEYLIKLKQENKLLKEKLQIANDLLEQELDKLQEIRLKTKLEED